MRNLLITLSFLLLFHWITCFKAVGKSSFSVDKWKEYVDNIAMEEGNEEAVETLYNDLSYLADNPLELNSLTEEGLRRLPFLTDKQISALLTYKERYGRMLTVYELKNVEGMDYNTLELLLPFVYIDGVVVDKLPITVDNLLKKGRNELYIRYDPSFQQKEGYKPVADSILALYPNRKYLGESFYHSLRYSYSFDERVQLGIVAEKDAGEPFMNKYHKGYDYYSVSLLIKDFKRLKTLAVGDYKMAFGQGVVVSNDYSPSRSMILSQAERRNNGFRRHYSTNESDFFRGIGATFAFDRLKVSVFYSRKDLSGTVDSLLITSLKTDGLNQLQRDWEKRNQVSMQTFGANMQYVSSGFRLGVTALNYSFDGKRYDPELKPYNLYSFRGVENTNGSVDYMFRAGAVKLFGETALSSNRAWATLTGLQLQPASYASFLILYRNYNKAYQAFYANAFSQNSSPQNEEGVYLGMQFTPVAYWKLTAYADVFRFPWLKYGVDAPSSGKEYRVQVEHNQGRSRSFLFSYRYKQTEETVTTDNITRIEDVVRHRIRFLFTHTTPVINLRTSLDGVGYEKGLSGFKKGWMIGQSISAQPEKGRWRGDFFAAWFDTDNSSVTVGSYEKTPMYVYYRPSFYGRGVRLALSLRYDVTTNLMLSLKLASVSYFDRDTIGTGLEEIAGQHKTDMTLLFRWKF